MTKEITISEFDKKTKNQKIVYSNAEGTSWEVRIFFNKDELHYYTVGPFGRWEGSVCYDLGELSLDKMKECIHNFETTSMREHMSIVNKLD